MMSVNRRVSRPHSNSSVLTATIIEYREDTELDNELPPLPSIIPTEHSTSTQISPLSLNHPQLEPVPISVTESSAEYFSACSGVSMGNSLLDWHQQPITDNLVSKICQTDDKELPLMVVEKQEVWKHKDNQSKIEEEEEEDQLRSLSVEGSVQDHNHLPPIPRRKEYFTNEFYSRDSIRGQVERTQSLRYFPPNGFTERMEDRLLRYRASAPSSNIELLLSESHPLQNKDLEKLELKSPNGDMQVRNNNDIEEDLELMISTSGMKKPKSVSERLAKKITEKNNNPSSSFVSDIPVPFKLQSKDVENLRAHCSPGSSIDSIQISHESEIGSPLTRSPGRDTDLGEGTNSTFQVNNSATTFRNPRSVIIKDNPTTISTGELLRGLNNQQSDADLKLPTVTISQDLRSCLFPAVVTKKNSFHEMTLEAPVARSARSQQPLTTSAPQFEEEQFRKLQESDERQENAFLKFFKNLWDDIKTWVSC